MFIAQKNVILDWGSFLMCKLICLLPLFSLALRGTRGPHKETSHRHYINHLTAGTEYIRFFSFLFPQ